MTYLKLTLIRHAESTGNVQGMMEGQSSTALSDKGIRQAEQLRMALTDELLDNEPRTKRLSSIYSSPLLRATQTADILITSIESSRYQISGDLQEIHQGIFQGLTWSAAQRQYPRCCAQLLSTRQWQPVPEAESLATARTRAQTWISQILHRHRPGEVVWAVSHAGIMQQMVSVILGCDRTWKIPIHHTARFEFWLSQTSWQALTTDRYNPEYWILRRFNDDSHLID